MAGVQSEAAYIGCRNGMVDKWVALRLIFDVCTREKGYRGGGGAQEGCMVVPVGAGDTAKGNLVVYLTGGQ